ncbi:hypothetical protein M0804_013960 [Polistes exclamans]|nr:hypothetical protein M0804_013960 [Polistes exclamans]
MVSNDKHITNVKHVRIMQHYRDNQFNHEDRWRNERRYEDDRDVRVLPRFDKRPSQQPQQRRQGALTPRRSQPSPNIRPPHQEPVRSKGETHPLIAAVDTNVSRKVLEFALAYYTATLVYARELKVLMISGRRVSLEEETFMNLVYAGGYRPPASISFYLKGFGNTKLQNQRKLKFRMRPRPVHQSEDGSIGWFGQTSIPIEISHLTSLLRVNRLARRLQIYWVGLHLYGCHYSKFNSFTERDLVLIFKLKVNMIQSHIYLD